MSTINCEACGAPLTVAPGAQYVCCEYCGTQNSVEQLTMNTANSEKHRELNVQKSNAIVISIPSCGSSIFEKKIFNVYRNYAELVDTKSKNIEIHVDYCNVAKRTSFLGSNIVFKMKNGMKYVIKTTSQKNYQLVQQALNGLV